MKNFKIFLLIFLLPLCAAAQDGQLIKFGGSRPQDTAYAARSLRLDSVLRALYYATSDTNKVLGVNAQGYLVLRTKGTGSGTATDTSSLSTRIDARVKYTDTAAMLVNYLRKADTSTLNARINLKQAYSDTNTYDATKKNLADTSALLRTLIAGSVSGVSNVTATSPLASSGGSTPNITIDTGIVSTKANVVAVTATKLNISDTAAMLTPYLRKADTTAMLVPYLRSALGVKYTDTAAMLANYYRTATATAALALKANLASPTFTGTVTIPTGANITTPNILSLSSGSTNDSLVVADPSTGALKRISSARISGGGGGSGWNLTRQALAATGELGSSNAFGVDFYTNNVRVGRLYTTGSVALSELASSSGNWGIALGYNATTGASNHEVAIGQSTQANALRSTAIGPSSQVNSVDGICISSGTGENETVVGGTTIGAYGGIRMPTTGTTVTVGRTSGISLGVTSTVGAFVFPVMTNAQKGAIASPAAGYSVYCSDCTATDASTGVVQTYNGTTWKNHW